MAVPPRGSHTDMGRGVAGLGEMMQEGPLTVPVSSSFESLPNVQADRERLGDSLSPARRRGRLRWWGIGSRLAYSPRGHPGWGCKRRHSHNGTISGSHASDGHRRQAYLCLVQPPKHLPEVLGEELFADWLAVNPNPLPDLHQVWGTTGANFRINERRRGVLCKSLVSLFYCHVFQRTQWNSFATVVARGHRAGGWRTNGRLYLMCELDLVHIPYVSFWTQQETST